MYILQRIKDDGKKEFITRSQTQYLFSICKALGMEGKNPEDVIKEAENPQPIRTEKEIEEEVFAKFRDLKQG